MCFKVVTLTLVLLVQITDQGKIKTTNNWMQYFNQPNHSVGNGDSRKARQYENIGTWLDKNPRYQKKPPNSKFLEVMNYIMQTPDYGLKYTEDQQNRFEFPSFPGFHNLIEVRDSARYPYIPNRLKEQHMPIFYKKKPLTMKSPYQHARESHENQPSIYNQLKEYEFSKEGFSILDDSHEPKKLRPGSVANKMERSTSMQNFYFNRKYTSTDFSTTVAKVIETSSYPSILSLAVSKFFEKINTLPFKQVKTRNQEQDEASDEDEDEEKSKYIELY